jgi:hypothetical protein
MNRLIFGVAVVAAVGTFGAGRPMACTSGTPSIYDDAAANASTRCSVPLGGSNQDYSSPTDHDWFKLKMDKGKSYRIHALQAQANFIDTKLVIRNASGTILATNSNASRYTTNSIVGPFVAPYTGTYFADVSAENGSGSFSQAGVFFSQAAPAAVCKNGSLPGFTRDKIISGTLTKARGGIDYCFSMGKGSIFWFQGGRIGGEGEYVFTQILDANSNFLYNVYGIGLPATYTGTYYLRVAIGTLGSPIPTPFKIMRSE